jgi:hypothetical protein
MLAVVCSSRWSAKHTSRRATQATETGVFNNHPGGHCRLDACAQVPCKASPAPDGLQLSYIRLMLPRKLAPENRTPITFWTLPIDAGEGTEPTL